MGILRGSNSSCSQDWGAAARRGDHSQRMEVARQAGALTPASPAWGRGPVWHVVLPGRRWPPVHRRGPSVLMLLTWRWMWGQTSSWALGCCIHISDLDFKPACPEVSGFRSISGLAGVKNKGVTRLGSRQAWGRVVRELAWDTGCVKGSDLSIGSHVCGLHPHWFGGKERGVPAPSQTPPGEQPDPSWACSSHAPHWSLLGWGFGEGKGVVPRRGQFGIAQSFVHVGDRPGLHVLLKERFALGGIFLSGDLGAVSFRGESVVCGAGRRERLVPTPGKARRSSRVTALAPGGGSQKCSLQSQKQGQGPSPGSLGAGGLAGTPAASQDASSARCRPRRSKAVHGLV